MAPTAFIRCNMTTALAPRNKRTKKGSKKGKKFTPKEVNEILFWWVFCKENNNRTAEIVSQQMGRKINRKVIGQMAAREDFHIKAPFVQSSVDLYKREKGLDTPEMTPEQIMLVGMGKGMLEIDHMIVRKAKDFISGIRKESSGFRNIKEVVDALRYVDENVKNLFQRENLRRDAWEYTEEQEGAQIAVSATKILGSIPKTAQYEVVNDLEERIIQGDIN